MMRKLSQLLELRYRISSQLYLGIGAAVFLTVAASLVGWFSFDRVGDAQSRVNEGSVPEIAAAFAVAQHSGELVAAATSLSVATTPADVERVGHQIRATYASFAEQLSFLSERGGDQASLDQIRDDSNRLIANIGAVEDSMSEQFRLIDRSAALRLELADLRLALDREIVPAIDDHLFYTRTGYLELGEPPHPPSEHLSVNELAHLRYLSEMQENANIAIQLLTSASTVSEAALIEPMRERFESSMGHIKRSLHGLSDSPLHGELIPMLDQLQTLGEGTRGSAVELEFAAIEGLGLFDLRTRELQLDERQRELLTNNYNIAALLVGEVDVLVSTAQARAQAATEASGQAIFTGRTLLLAITAVSIAGAVLIAWLFVGRVLLRRLAMLSDWMRRMAGGDLEARAEITGRDEVADMAAALEVFRRHALEVQRLNLVEQLAEELQGKNDELERTNNDLEQAMSDLNTAQDQIVMREKLAALGELTAGVAHEIRNPLNFVKNFSEVSEELLEEMKETIEESEDGTLGEEQRELLDDIFGELSGNLERIQTHGDRANRIVHDMLMMSRESVGHQPTNINNLLDEHARLAYHSARATDSNFQLDLQYDFDPDMEEIEVNPQDVGRVFLNIVNNGCYATNEKRLKLADSEPGSDYMPTLLLTTRRGEERIEVRIRDNGTGMPPEVIEKMFNPFFTTKPTDKGTGLGLSICNDIIRRHGGEILVESKPGEFTEMTIDLPLHPPMEDADHDEIYDDDDDWEEDEDAVGVADVEESEAV